MTAFLTRTGLTAALLLAALPGAFAQGFSAYISPPRFEVPLTAGQTLRQVIEIQHVGLQKGAYRVYTNDWALAPDGSLSFSDTLQADSCRPWVAVERRELTIEPGARYRYRFEITPPADTPPRECRFAIMVEGLDPARLQGALNFPVGGRIAVIVYAAIGGAAPKLELLGTQVSNVNGTPTAVLSVRNSGNATGRLDGFVDGVDPSGAKLELAPADVPILPGQTRLVGLSPVIPEGKPAPAVRFPLKIKGALEWGKERLPVDARLSP